MRRGIIAFREPLGSEFRIASTHLAAEGGGPMEKSTKLLIQVALKEAILARDGHRKSTLRLALAAIKRAEVEEQHELDEAAVHTILQKEVKLCRESIADAERAGRQKSIRDSEREIAILESFLPAQLSEEAIRTLATQAIVEADADSLRAIGAVMKILMPRLQGQADGGTVSRIVRELLAET